MTANCDGCVVVTGVGKAGLVGQKLVATLASTGTPSHFLHPSEAQHGDLGIIRENDVLVVLSNSGKTREILELVDLTHTLHSKVPVIIITGHGDISTAIEATRQGAFDFFEKPLQRDRVLLSLRNALESYRLQKESQSYQVRADELIGSSEPMRRLRETIKKAWPGGRITWAF